MPQSRSLRCAVLAALLAAILHAAPSAIGQTPSSSAALAKQLTTALAAASQTALAVKDPDTAGRFIAVLHIPGVQMLVVSAAYERPTDIEYRIYKKDFMTAYMDLNSSTLAKDKIVLEDIGADGLLFEPAEGALAGDVCTEADKRQVFDGVMVEDGKRKKDMISESDYTAAFTKADTNYTRMLKALIAALKT